MQWGIRALRAGVLLGIVAVAGYAGELGPKAKKLTDKGVALCREGHQLWKKLILDEPEGDERLALVKTIVAKYDAGLAQFEKALEIEEHAGIRARLSLASRHAFKMRAHLFWLKQHKKVQARKNSGGQPEPAKPDPKQEPKPEPGPKKEPREDKSDHAANPPDPDDVANEIVAAVSFDAGKPPAVPVALDLDAPEPPDDEDTARTQKRDGRRIRARIKSWLGARKKIAARHALCRGEGKFSDGTECEECCGTGRLINLHEFRKAFWASYSPILRGTGGAYEALTSFREAAQKDATLVGPLVKSFSVKEIDHHGLWAKATVHLKTTDGKTAIKVTLISTGSAWYLYCPRTDHVLLPGGSS